MVEDNVLVVLVAVAMPFTKSRCDFEKKRNVSASQPAEKKRIETEL